MGKYTEIVEKKTSDDETIGQQIWKTTMKTYHKVKPPELGHPAQEIKKIDSALSVAEENLKYGKSLVIESEKEIAEQQKKLDNANKQKDAYENQASKRYNHLLKLLEKELSAYIAKIEDEATKRRYVREAMMTFVDINVVGAKVSVEDAKKALPLIKKTVSSVGIGTISLDNLQDYIKS